MTGRQIEAELKFRAEDDRPLRTLAAAASLGPARLGPARVVDEVDRYLDTADGRLAAARWACRLRSREGRTFVSLKGPAEHEPGDALHRRPEVEGPAAAGLAPNEWPPSPGRELLLALTAGEPLVERFTLEQERTEREVLLHGVRVGLLSLDRVRVIHRQADLGRMLVVELEIDPAALAAGLDHASLALPLREAGGLAPDPLSKFERALAMLAA